MSTNFEKLKSTLRKVFEIDKAELDFGVYRILNQKRDEINRFMENDLLKQVEEDLEGVASFNREELEKELASAIEQAKKYGSSDPENVEPVLEIKRKLDVARNVSSVEQEVYSYLHTFFSRYYEKGDFISARRYKKDTYAIPYEGEEVKLHWANADQYYVKSSEYFRDYTFTVKSEDDKVVRIKILEADIEKDNRKEQGATERKFVVDRAKPLSVEEDELRIHFNYVPMPKEMKQTKLNEDSAKFILEQDSHESWLEILKTLSPTEKNKKRTILEKHLNDFTARNTFDYFIHKDLRGFLTRELDFYIKNEILFLDDLDFEEVEVAQRQIKVIKCVKSIGGKIIDFLSQVENFQKKLWEKKKFVIDSNYFLSVDKLPEELIGELLSNDYQWKEWVDLGFLEDIPKDKEKELSENIKLIVDTKHFSVDFKNKLLSEFHDIDSELSGLLINSDNFQALNLIEEKYNQGIDYIYLDPPYNTNEETFLYKNDYKHSSWASMMNNGLLKSKSLLKEKGVISVAIDDLEQPLLAMICDNAFGMESRLGTSVVEIKPSGRTNDNFFATSHEYVLFYGMNVKDTEITFFELTEAQKGKYADSDGEGAFKWRDFLRTGGFSTPEERPNSYYPIYHNEETGEISLESSKGLTEILPIDSEGKKRVWRKTKPSFLEHLDKGEIKVEKNKQGQWKVRLIDRIKEGTRPKSVWVDSKYDASSHGTKLLKAMFGDKSPFSFPKSLHAVSDHVYVVTGANKNATVLDYFAGSGTTAHAVIDLNRRDGGKRKFIMVEMGEYFNTVTVPRVKKSLFSASWKSGLANDNDSGVSHIVKYISVESYEDSIHNLILDAPSGDQIELLSESKSLSEEYMLSYWLDIETRGSSSLLNLDSFQSPRNYKMNIATDSVSVTREVNIDLIETFNLLLGLQIENQSFIDGFDIVEGKNSEGEKALVIWRDTHEKDNKSLEDFMSKLKYHPRDTEFSHIYINGDNNLDDPLSKVKMTEGVFKSLMFNLQN